MDYAIISLAGRQHKVKPGDQLQVSRLDAKVGDTVDLDQVLLIVNQGQVKFGQPLLKNTSLKAKVIKHLKGKKLRVATFRAKSRYRRVKGHRDHLTQLEILAAPQSKSSSKSSSKPKAKKTSNSKPTKPKQPAS